MIHSDLQRGFIRAEVIHWDELLTLGSWNAAKDAGKLRVEGKEYEVVDGDVVEIPGPTGPQAVRLEQTLMVPSPSGVPTGFPGRASSMMELPTGLPLSPGIYRWQVRVNGKEEDDWSAHFYVASPPQAPTFGFPPPSG